MTYEYRCTQCGLTGDVQHPANVAVFVVCSDCRGMAERYFSPESVPYHQEDRRHMRAGLSRATGQAYAQSRKEERVIEKERGIEFISKRDLTEQQKTLREHFQHTKTGGEPVAPNVLNPPPSPKVEPGTILREMRKRGISVKRT